MKKVGIRQKWLKTVFQSPLKLFMTFFIRGLLLEVDRRIKRGVERLRLTQCDNPENKTPQQLKQEKVDALKEKINGMIKEAERLGEQGNIEEAQVLLESCDTYKNECRYLEQVNLF